MRARSGARSFADDEDLAENAFVLDWALRTFRIETECLELSAPFGWQIAETLDADAAGQTTFESRLDKIGGKEGERDGHVDLPDAAFLASAKFCGCGHPT
jgi:hypothetical protein